MHDFKNIETSVLLTILTAYVGYYKRLLSKKEYRDCKKIIIQLETELAFRQKYLTCNTGTDPGINAGRVT